MRARIMAATAAAAALISVCAGEVARSADQTPVGLWQAVDDDTKQPTGWFLISDHDGVFDGIIARMFLKPGEDPNAICDQCKDDRHNHPWLGLQIIRGMKLEGTKGEEEKFAGGTILDPRDGKTYKSTMRVSPDGQTLIVRGYIGLEILGRNQYWSRLPDSAYTMLDPSVYPPSQPAAPGTANQKRPATAAAPPPHNAAAPAPAQNSSVKH
jgi:uncharacterized protein (DUF2147 family)